MIYIFLNYINKIRKIFTSEIAVKSFALVSKSPAFRHGEYLNKL